METKDPKSPATTSLAYDAMVPRWQVVSDLLGGTEAMRAAGETHLPKHRAETEDDYASRLQAANLFNMFEETLNELASKPFSETMKLNEDVPEDLLPLLDNIDLQGNNLQVFCQEWFKEGLAKAFCHVLIDAPRATPRADGQKRTLDDDRRDGIRPFWTLIRPENVIFIFGKIEGGVEVLEQIRIMECTLVQDGFAEVVQRRIRVLEPGRVTLYRPKPTKVGQKKEEWEIEEQFESGRDFVPFLTFYPGAKEGIALSKPALLDLGYMNITHWQSTSEQRHCLTVARFPILAASGVDQDDEDQKVKIAPNTFLSTSDAQGKYYYVEHTGAALEAGASDLERLEEQMSSYGAEFLKNKPGDETATAKAIDTAESNSDLAQMVGKFEDVVAQALSITAAWMGLGEEGGTIELCKDYTPEEADSAGLGALATARGSRDISRKAYLNGLRLRGVLPEDFDIEEDAEELQSEMDSIMSLGGTAIELDPLGNPKIVAKKDDPEDGDPAEGGKPAVKKAPAKKAAVKKAPVKAKK